MSSPAEDPQPRVNSPDQTPDALKWVTGEEKGQILAQTLESIYETGAKLYTKDMFRTIELTLSKQPKTKPTEVFLSSMIDVDVKIGIPPLEEMEPGEPQHVPFTILLPYRKLMAVAEKHYEGEAGADALLDPTIPEYKVATLTCPVRMSSARIPIPAVPYKYMQLAWEWIEKTWMQSTFRKELVGKLKQVDQFPNVSRVVCHELGLLSGMLTFKNILNPVASLKIHQGYRNYFSYFVALTVAQVLAEQRGDSPPLKVAAEDFRYSPQDKTFLTETGIQVINGYGTSVFRLIDDETILICCGPRPAVKEVIADIARPAAMLWIQDLLESKEETEDGEVCESRVRKFSFTQYPDSPRVIELLERYTKHEIEAETETFKAELHVRKT